MLIYPGEIPCWGGVRVSAVIAAQAISVFKPNVASKMKTTTPHPHQMSEENGKTKRVVRACDVCRSRKLKCDAALPACTRCSDSGMECTYTHTEKKKKQKVKRAAAKMPTSITDLDHRMSRMESLITTLVEKLDPTLAVRPNEETSGADQDDDSECDDFTSPPLAAFPEENVAESHQDATKLGVHNKYFGSQSTFSVLSAKGLVWLGKRVGDASLLPRFQDFHTRIASIFLWVNRRWIDPIEKSQLAPFPEREVTMRMVDHFYDDFCFGPFILGREELKEMFDIYYRLPSVGRKMRRLTNSDFLTMNSCLAVGSQFYVDALPREAHAERSQIEEIHTKVAENAIYYYTRVAVISEGLRTVQALLVFNIFAEFARGPPHNYMLVSSMVRFAQELGLHRRESLVGLSRAETTQRRRLWLLVVIFDRNCCLMSGKPPIINIEDVSSVLPHEFDDVLFADVPKDVVAQIKDVDFDAITAVEQLESQSNDPNVYMKSPLLMLTPYYNVIFIEFTTKVYDRLFSAHALRGKSLNQVLALIEELNEELDYIVEHFIAKCMRPGANIKDIKSFRLKYDIATIHFQYYHLAMIINRMAFTRAWLNHDSTDETLNSNNNISPLQFKLMNKCLENSRHIIELVHDMSPCAHRLFVKYTSFQFFSAFFTIFTGLLEFPQSPHFRDDVDLVFKVSAGLLEDMSNDIRRLDDICTCNIICFSVRFFMRIAILTHNSNNPTDAIDTKTLDAELDHYDNAVTQMSSDCNQKLRTDDPLCVMPPSLIRSKQSTNNSTEPIYPARVSGPVRQNESLARSIGSNSNSNSPSTITQMQPGQPLNTYPRQPSPFQVQPKVYPHMYRPMQQSQQLPNGTEELFNTDMNGFPSPLGVNGLSQTGTTPEDRTLEMFENEMNANLLQQVFALPDFYLNMGESGMDVNPNLMF